MPERAFFIGLAAFLVWIAAETAVIYVGARLARIGNGSVQRAFVAALVSGFTLLLAVSFTRDSVGVNPTLLLAMFAVIALVVIPLCLRTAVIKVVIPWLGAVLLLGIAFLAWRLLPGN
jgi:FtsH-binding integral membrane protein